MKIKEFWNWFESLNVDFLNFGIKSEIEQQRLIDLITEKLHAYCEDIYPLFSYKENENTLIITANGVNLYFDEVEKLMNDVPKIENWNLIAFSPKIEFDNLTFHDLSINISELYFLPWEFPEEPSNTAFYLYLNDYENKSKSEWLSLAIEKCLLLILGEKKYGDKVNFYTINDLNLVKKAVPIIELEKYIDSKSIKF